MERVNVLTAEPLRTGAVSALRVTAAGRRVVLDIDGVELALHPLWLRERSGAAGTVDPNTRQRLVEPGDVPLDLTVLDARVDGADLVVAFSDGYRCTLPVDGLAVDLGVVPDPEDPPEPVAWRGAVERFPTIDWGDIGAVDAVLDVLGGFFRYGFMLVRGTDTEPGSLVDIASAFGRINPTNFGVLFDVVSVPEPVDLAYTPVGLSAHTDQPYRGPSPCIQFLHALANEAPGGDSTIVDGLAAVEALRASDPEAFEVLSTTDVQFRYDIGTDVVVGRSPMIELDRRGGLRRLRFSPRLDFAPAIDPDTLDVYYRGRRWLAAHLNDPANLIAFRLEAGDALVVDNARVLHGRTPFDPTIGNRHLQGCYIDHDGPDTMWRLALRRRMLAGGSR